jgi:hypothetical protein
MSDSPHVFEQAMREALAHVDTVRVDTVRVDTVRAQLEPERAQLAAEREAARDARRQHEAPGEEIVEAYLGERRAALVAFARRELRRELALRMAGLGANADAIAHWLDLSADEVAASMRVTERREEWVRAHPHQATVATSGAGRGGQLHYADTRTRFSMWWEFAGGDALALVGIPTPAQWEAQTRLPVSERSSVLQVLAAELVALHAGGGGHAVFDDQVLVLYSS